ncbi:S24 family peptidase [Sphingomonas sp. LHG3406-1]|uniref:S24 family peptidase n=1 Tax=Sphingomonas sp. LHG3406-1 TaxID=2804617 RepID=UPI00260A3959|nr:S24 family peptidase [Sphingomonas sp. LHG3406-1]
MGDKIVPIDEPRALLQRLCVERGEDFASLSRLLGRNSAYIQQYVRRGTPRRLPERERRILARHFGVSERALGGEFDAATLDGYVRFEPVEGRGAPAMAFARDWLEALAPEDRSMLRSASVGGDAMAPTLQAQDELLVDVADGADRLRDGLYLLRIEGALQVRRLTLHPVRREVTVQSDNPAYADWPGLAPSDLDLVGRVLWIGRRLS